MSENTLLDIWEMDEKTWLAWRDVWESKLKENNTENKSLQNLADNAVILIARTLGKDPYQHEVGFSTTLGSWCITSIVPGGRFFGFPGIVHATIYARSYARDRLDDASDVAAEIMAAILKRESEHLNGNPK